jgi:hypothetical protein
MSTWIPVSGAYSTGVGVGVGVAEGAALGVAVGPPMIPGNTIAAHAVRATARITPSATSSFFLM